MNYAGGIYSSPTCNRKYRNQFFKILWIIKKKFSKNLEGGINHAVVVVGYGQENGNNYW
jgi:hypothetical protein